MQPSSSANQVPTVSVQTASAPIISVGRPVSLFAFVSDSSSTSCDAAVHSSISRSSRLASISASRSWPHSRSSDKAFEQLLPPDAFEPLFRSFMRVLDLVVQHGARSSFDDLNLNDMIHVKDGLNHWILARPDCTPRIREAINRGDLSY